MITFGLLLAAALCAPSRAAKSASLAPTQPETLDAPLPDDPMRVIIRRLPNGLTVYMSPDHDSPRVSAWIAVRAGSKNDPADSTGIAHYLEHMLFKGTRKLGTLDYAAEKPHLDRIESLLEERAQTSDAFKRSQYDALIDSENVADAAYAVPNEIDKFYAAIGAQGLNAFTSNEETVFVVNIPANRLEAWAAVESERFLDPVFRLFPTELEAVYEEKNRSLDNAEQALDEELGRRLYKVHPYGQQTTLGRVEHLKNPSLKRMREFYERWYVPNNMAIALAGDFDPDRAMEIISRRFGAWTPRALPAPATWPLPKPRGEETYEIRYEGPEKVAIAWPTVPAGDPDADAITVMDMLMDNATTGLLNLRLNQAQKVQDSGSYPRLRNDAGDWTVWAVPKKGQTLEQAKALLLDAVDALKRGEFEQSDLDAIVTNFEVERKRRLESDDGRVAAMIDSFIADEPWSWSVERLDRLRRVTKDEVVRAARKYLGEDRVVVLRRDAAAPIARIDKPKFTPLSIDPARRSAFLQAALALPAQPLEPRWLVAGRDYTIVPIAGGRLYAAKNPDDDLFDLSLRFDRGARQERRLCQALRLLDLAGAGPDDAAQFKRRLYALGSSLSYDCGDRSSSIEISGIDRNFWPTLELMTLRFDLPTVSSADLSGMIGVELGERADEKKDPDAVFSALTDYAQHGADGQVARRLSDRELKALDLNSLKELIRDFPRWQRRVGYVGPRSPSEVAKLLETSAAFKPSPQRPALWYVRPPRTRVIFSSRTMVQARVGLFAADETFDPARVVDYMFYNQYMGGDMGSVIFQEVREARSLAYSAGGGHTIWAKKGDETRAWGYLGCQADKTPEAVRLMLTLMRDFPASPQRFAAAESAIEQNMRTNPVAFREIPDQVMDWEDEGFVGGDPGPRLFSRVKSYTLGDLQAFASRLHDAPFTVSVLGDPARVETDALKPLGDFEQKPVDALFPY